MRHRTRRKCPVSGVRVAPGVVARVKSSVRAYQDDDLPDNTDRNDAAMKTLSLSSTCANRYASCAAPLAAPNGIRRMDGGSGVDVTQY